MGSSYVTLRTAKAGEDAAAISGFWMRDEMLELWLRLLALHVEEPGPEDGADARLRRSIRDQWLLASRGWFGGCVPHALEAFTATPEGGAVVRQAVESLNAALQGAESLDAATLNLIGFEHPRTRDVDAERLRDVGRAFLDLLDGRITGANHDCGFMPGTITPSE